MQRYPRWELSATLKRWLLIVDDLRDLLLHEVVIKRLLLWRKSDERPELPLVGYLFAVLRPGWENLAGLGAYHLAVEDGDLFVGQVNVELADHVGLVDHVTVVKYFH